MAASAKDPDRTEQGSHFFVSYTGADVAWAEWIAWQLEAAGYRVLIQAWDFGAGSDFVTEMRRATARAERTLAVLSPAYVASGFAIAEWNAAFAADPTGEARKLVPVRVVDFVPDGLDATRVYIDLVGLGEPAARERLLAAVRTRRTKPSTSPPFPHWPTTPAPFPGQVPVIWNVPARNPNFAGRDRQLEELRSALSANAGAVAVLAVSGLGGVGKTQLGIEHAWRRTADYDLVWWVPAEIPNTIAGVLTSLAGRLGLATDDSEAVVGLLQAELAQRRRWLLIFDNATDPAALGLYLPPAGAGQVLITSRNPAWRGRGSTLDLDVWAESEAIAFLVARTGGDDEDDAQAVAADLGYLPLALEQAGAYVEETGMALSAYRDLLASRRAAMLKRGTPAFYRHTVATTFGLAYQWALRASPAAAAVLGTAALLAPDDIPTGLLSSGDPLADEDALAILRRLALVRRHGDSVALHRLVGDVVRQRMGPEEKARRVRAALAALGEAFPSSPEDHRSWPLSARLLPHVLAVADHAPQATGLGAVLHSAGIYLRSRAQLGLAAELLERALQLQQATDGPNHPEVARTVSNLGIVRRDLGELPAAREHQERALRIYEAIHGSNHPQVAKTLNNLGSVLRNVGDLGAARDHLARALRIQEAGYGPDHPEVAGIVGNLGLVHRDLGDLTAAREHLERALRIEEGAWGPDDPRLAKTLNHLGSVLRGVGDLAAARDRLDRALRIDQAVYGPDHPELASKVNNLGIILHELGDLAAAREHLARALRIHEAAYGADHPEVASTLNNLGAVMRDLGELDTARDCLERALRIREASYGPDHPEVARTLINLGTVMRALD